jgi:hypothetical protein
MHHHRTQALRSTAPPARQGLFLLAQASGTITPALNL